MAKAGLGSRRQSESIIAEGRVRVNGQVAKLGDKADPSVDRIEVDGQVIGLSDETPIYIILHKPRGVISSLEDELEEGRTTVRDLIPLDASVHIYPVGRLDKPSEGLMLMTNDGELAHRLTHPRYEHEKMYTVIVDGRLTDDLVEQWRRGVMLDGRITAPAPIEILDRRDNLTKFRIILREGRKRQIRRIAAELGHPVHKLIRDRIGPLELGDLPPGQWRYLTESEVAKLQAYAATDASARGKSGSR